MLAAVALLTSGPLQGGFALAGFGVEIAGLALLFRSHLTVTGNQK